MTERPRHPEEPLAFYAETGLRFACQRCSACCRYSPGFVLLSAHDLSDLREAVTVPWDEFKKRYLRALKIGPFIRVSLTEKSNYDCVFWEDGGCRVYEHRPFQCRSFPFWTYLVSSPAAWAEYKSNCPGIDSGPVHAPEEINAWLEARVADQLIELETENLESLTENDLLDRTDP
jgi:Fe-S-cluster containining protein